MHLRRRTAAATVTVVTAAIALAGVHVAAADGSAPVKASPAAAGQAAVAAVPLTLTINAAPDKGGRRSLAHPLTATVTGGTLTSVTGTVTPLGVSSATRTVALGGVVAPSGTSWTSEPLKPSRAYHVTAIATGPDGAQVSKTAVVRSAKPAKKLSATISPSHVTVGVGMPITVNLSRPVPSKAGKAAVQSALQVSATKPIGRGSWGWLSDSQLQFRPQHFWPGNTKVTVRAALAGVFAGKKAGWAVADTRTKFTVGRSQIMRVSGTSHSFTIKRNGRTVLSGGVSLGKPGFTTRSGIKVIMTREVSHHMVSTSIGIPDGSADSYDLDVPYAMRVTNSGEFVHGAPWNPNIGYANTSHGCTNLSLSNAIWVYNNSILGDPVITTGTSRGSELGNGLGGAWNLSWKQWTKLSAVPV
jgi:lipoprotein-anchoring transpeptidase ErfK/SrfK